MVSLAAMPLAVSGNEIEALKVIAINLAMNADPADKAGRDHASMDPYSFTLVQGSLQGHDSATGFPVRSHHLPSLSEGSS